MPGRVNAPMNGVRPATARDTRQADGAAQAAREAGGGQEDRTDRVEISGAARARNTRQMALAEARRAEEGTTALEAQGARPPEARPRAVAGEGAATRTAELRQQQNAAQQQAANTPRERPGSLVDVTG